MTALINCHSGGSLHLASSWMYVKHLRNFSPHHAGATPYSQVDELYSGPLPEMGFVCDVFGGLYACSPRIASMAAHQILLRLPCCTAASPLPARYGRGAEGSLRPARMTSFPGLLRVPRRTAIRRLSAHSRGSMTRRV